MILLASWLAVVLLAGWPAVVTGASAATAPAPPTGSPQAPAPPATATAPSATVPATPGTALQLFAAVEQAWAVSDAERLASLVDTTCVRIALKPGAPPTTAMNRVSAAFLFQDPMHLVKTSGFRVVRLDVPEKGPARATARWTGDWGGRQGVRRVRINFIAAPRAGVWLLTEVHSSD